MMLPMAALFAIHIMPVTYGARRTRGGAESALRIARQHLGAAGERDYRVSDAESMEKRHEKD